MIEKMKYINITGHLSDIDRVVEKYISKYEIQFEYAARELKNINGLEPVNLPNPYVLPLKIAERFAKAAGGGSSPASKSISADEAFKNIEAAERFFTAKSHEITALNSRKKLLSEIAEEIEPFRNLDFNVKDLDELKFIKYRFGKMPLSNYKQFKVFLHDKAEILFVKGKTDANYVWGVYFAADSNEEMVESIFSSLQFIASDFTYILDGTPYNGSPNEYYEFLSSKISGMDSEVKRLESQIINEADIKNDDLIASYKKILNLYNVFEIKKYAAQTVHDYYIFVGWMPESGAIELESEMERDDKVVFMIEENPGGEVSRPPTKLKNISLFKPFEFFVEMYGLPAYGEFDPTVFVAVTYTIIFGLMFGDLGQGFALSLMGFFLYRKKGLALGRIMSVIGVSSMFFGFMYGSFFGFEHFIPTIWMKPAENINFILITTVGIGFFLILTAMSINIAIHIRSGRYMQMFFDPNGFAGIIFYLVTAVSAISVLTGSFSVNIGMMVIVALISLMMIAFREPALKIIRKERGVIHGGIGMFLMETVIELFEVVLSYLTNTISFVRVGAFALSHAGMMSVVLLLSETASGSHNIIVIILGNILVMALEGLVVGIQVLRLEFYEMFSRFYRGDGRRFVPSVKK